MSPTSTGRKLVIVESPAKAKTIAGYLGPDWIVEASVGHIRDIPTPSEMPADMKKGPFGRFGVDVDNDFEPYYVVDADKKKKVAELKKALKSSTELYLATDEDREGEAIAWHLLETLQPKVPVKRMVFHEITKEAIQRAAANTRDLDTALVDAQETRRILDRLYGYEISPVLWRKVKAGLSAGRVQSVTTRMVVERERERMAFRSANYWDVEGEFTPDAASSAFTARLSQVDGKRVASGRDFGDDGRLKGEVAHLDEAAATGIAHAVLAADVTVTNVAEKPYTRRPSAPFTTSTLQQEASRKLRLSSKNAMRVAQRLYENGYITYMRTDSTALSQSALTAARQQARDLYGGDYVPDAPRNYAKKVKNAQEAHEAIRPAGDRFRTPAQVAGEIRGDEFALYELIWKRTIASQMADAKGSTATVKLGATLDREAPAEQVEFTASGTVITFRGFMAAYEEGRDEQRNANADEERRLPRMGEGTELKVIRAEADGHDTSPPARYTEATLVKAMEEKGIGRPSTYASTIGTIQDRGYVSNRGNALVPSWLAFAVTRLMEEHFTRLVDYDFTASMEEDLDQIANGDAQRATWLKRFYFGDEATSSEGLRDLVADLGDIDARAISTIDIGDGIVVRVGRYGPYVEEVAPAGVDPVTGEVTEAYAGDSASEGDAPAAPRRATINDDIAPDEMTPEKARELLATAADDGRVLGQEPETGRDIIAKSGRYGPYVTEVLPEEVAALKGKNKVKPRTASLFKDMDLATLDLDTALKLLSLPRVVGLTTDKVTGEDGKESEKQVEITAQNGRYGPYLKKGTDSRSLETEQQLFDITLEQAEAIYAKPKERGRAAGKPPLKEFGPDPVSGKPVVVKDGRFGEYVTDGETNTTLRRDDDLETMTAARAFEMLAEKRAKGPTTRKRAAKKTVKKAATKKTAAKKTAAKKTTAKKATKKA
ncbi:putative DNA topoisomerase I [Janibacter sp. HTCC2649]|uniref:type I DNA topoisomerase n=1 Tax=Janibacter sp. HTCC2649 TaxID=313589 RepID=UPI00006708E5|nr:type I DNA topoisomerase [Janibacter sp. HTCC2649]EAQ00414.1 putative DNA topoisomerase I [Janibacter sp. HTCC2649]